MIEVIFKTNLGRAMLICLCFSFVMGEQQVKAAVPLAHQSLSKAENIGHLMGEWQFLFVNDLEGRQVPSLFLSNALRGKGYLEVRGQSISTSFDNINFSLQIIADSRVQAQGVLQIRNSRFSCHHGALKVYFTNGKFISFEPKACKSSLTIEAFSGKGEDAHKLAVFIRKYLPIFVMQNHLILKISHKENFATQKFRKAVLSGNSLLSE